GEAMKVKILKPGILSTVQDLGRNFYRAQGIPSAGAMDSLSMRLANLSLANAIDAAVIEITYADVLLEAETDLLIAYSGGGSILYASDQVLPDNRPLFVPAGQNLAFRHHSSGSRTYLDRKSTRLNSSHVKISYAVFCLKKKIN